MVLAGDRTTIRRSDGAHGRALPQRTPVAASGVLTGTGWSELAPGRRQRPAMRSDDPGDLILLPSAPGPEHIPAPRFDHLRSLTDEIGMWEHAEYRRPRTEHGFCTDDNARALIVVCREADPTRRTAGRPRRARRALPPVRVGLPHARRLPQSAARRRPLGRRDRKRRQSGSGVVGTGNRRPQRPAGVDAIGVGRSLRPSPGSGRRTCAPTPSRCWGRSRC
jgi:hypothetical protein